MPLARLYTEADRWSEVKAIFTRLLDSDPENPFLHAQLGKAYRALDSTDAAIVHYERAHRLDPQSIEVPLSLSGVYIATGKLIAARRVMGAGAGAASSAPGAVASPGQGDSGRRDVRRRRRGFPERARLRRLHRCRLPRPRDGVLPRRRLRARRRALADVLSGRQHPTRPRRSTSA